MCLPEPMTDSREQLQKVHSLQETSKGSLTVKLRRIAQTDYKFLYNMLKERKPEQSISFKMPTWQQHVSFVDGKPYDVWYIIEYNDRRIGNIYLTKNDEWGYFIKEEYIGKGLGTQAFKELIKKHPRSYYYANINPNNSTAIHQARDKFGGKLIQLTYKISRHNVLEYPDPKY